MPPDTSVPWTVLATIVGSLAALVGSLLVLFLRSIKQDLRALCARNDKQDDLIAANRQGLGAMTKQLSACKIDCQRVTVSKEDWVRSEGYTRHELKQVTAILHRLEGKLQVVEQLPEICGQIAREVAKQVKHGD